MVSYDFKELSYKYVLIPIILALAYVKDTFCPKEELIDQKNFEVIDGELTTKDDTSIKLKYNELEYIEEGMDIHNFLKKIGYDNNVKSLSIDYMHNDEYLQKEYQIETEQILSI